MLSGREEMGDEILVRLKKDERNGGFESRTETIASSEEGSRDEVSTPATT